MWYKQFFLLHSLTKSKVCINFRTTMTDQSSIQNTSTGWVFVIWQILVVLQERYFKYSMSNCLYSAMVAAIVKECNCIPIYSRVGWRGIYNGLGFISLFLNPKNSQPWSPRKHNLSLQVCPTASPLRPCHQQERRKYLGNSTLLYGGPVEMHGGGIAIGYIHRTNLFSVYFRT